MAASWIEPVEADQIVDGEPYFLAFRPRNEMQGYSFYCTDIRGKTIIASKPGIATQMVGNDKLRGILVAHPDHVAVKVPPDSHKRWKRRQRRI